MNENTIVMKYSSLTVELLQDRTAYCVYDIYYEYFNSYACVEYLIFITRIPAAVIRNIGCQEIFIFIKFHVDLPCAVSA